GCEDIAKFVNAYVDGEFQDDERMLFERHLAGCARCREVVSFQTLFKTNLRARLRRPEPPIGLRKRVLESLDRADADGAGPRRPFWRSPVLLYAVGAAATAMVAFGLLVPPAAKIPRPIFEECARTHEKNLPVEVGGTADNVRDWMRGKVPVPVRPPHIQDVALVGGRISHVSNRDAAELRYRVLAAPSSMISVLIFDATGWDLDDGGFYIGQYRGYNVVIVRNEGVGYAFASDLPQSELLTRVKGAFRQ